VAGRRHHKGVQVHAGPERKVLVIDLRPIEKKNQQMLLI